MKKMKILANDGLHPEGIQVLEAAGMEVSTEKISAEDLPASLPEYDGIIVRSATKIREALIDQCPDLKVIGRAGVGLDNIDVDYAKAKGMQVFNTPGASSRSVAELVFAHIFTLSRMFHDSNRNMPVSGGTAFKALKKQYAKGRELKGQTLGIIGMGRIGRMVGEIGLRMGMEVIGSDPFMKEVSIDMEFQSQHFSVEVPLMSLEEVLAQCDVVTLHVPFLGKPLLGENEFRIMKKGSLVINAARGGLVDEKALVESLDSGHLGGAGLDVFLNEPSPAQSTLGHPKISLSPHIGGTTQEAQKQIALDLANQIKTYFYGVPSN